MKGRCPVCLVETSAFLWCTGNTDFFVKTRIFLPYVTKAYVREG